MRIAISARKTHRARLAAAVVGIIVFSGFSMSAGFAAGTAQLATASQLVLEKAPEESRPCVKCHMEKGITGSAIRDWQLSKHAEKGVACANCHIPVSEASPGIASSASACEDKRVRRRVSPRNCAVCHPDKFEQFSQGKHSVAWGTMISMPTTAMQPHALIEGMKGCGGCHRVGLDEGKCDSCHTRHRFIAAEARRPEACMTCHMGFDHPQAEMYATSKHGSIYAIEGSRWNWNLNSATGSRIRTRLPPPGRARRSASRATCRMVITACTPRGDSWACGWRKRIRSGSLPAEDSGEPGNPCA